MIVAYLAWFITSGRWCLIGTYPTQDEAKRRCADHAFTESGFVKTSDSEKGMLLIWEPCRNGIRTSAGYEGRYEVIESEAKS